MIERAIHLRADLDVNAERIRPPYKGQWPHIPTEDEMKPFLADRSRGSYDSGDVEWSRNRIGHSVMEDDFARYVIGTNSWFTNGLSLRRDDAPWQPADERLGALVEAFSEEERSPWETFKAADDALRQLTSLERLLPLLRATQGEDSDDDERNRPPEPEELACARARAQEQRDAAFAALESVLTEDHARVLRELQAARNT